ncbi:hypothetical protein CDD83_522 [Cordyceps sp. RAO-2017]|nr:hypothetical protein CDD83_522 [Cordyceps sp. RAO-2017]
MRQTHRSVRALIWSTALFQATVGYLVPYNDALTIGQGYNTFLGRGTRHNAVARSDRTVKRDDLGPAAPDTNPSDEHMTFNFTAPSANMTGLDLFEYFTPPDPDMVDEAAKEGATDASDQEDGHTQAGVALAPRDVDPDACTSSVIAYYRMTEDFQ